MIRALAYVFAIVLFVFVHSGSALAQDNFPARIALVIGNGDYPNADRLVNPGNDARDIGAALGSIGFDADVQVDLDQREFGRAIDRFVAKLRSNPGALALFYFAGHGTQRFGERSDNLLWPAREKPEDSESSAQRLNVLLSRMHDAGAAAKVVILDACRTTRGAARGGARGLAVYDGRVDVLIAYAAAVGEIADDNPRERNGLYTKHLLEHLGTKGLPMYQTLSRTAESVRKARPQGQLPELRSLAADRRLSELPLLPAYLPDEAAALWSLLQGTGDCAFEAYFRRFPNGSMAAEARRRYEVCQQGRPRDPTSVELTLWDSIKMSSNRADFEEYLLKFPDGHFAGLARNRLQSVLPAQAAAAPSMPALVPVPVQNDLQQLAGRNKDQFGKSKRSIPKRWRSLDSGLMMSIRVDGDFMYVEADPPEHQRRAGAFGLSELKRQGDRYIGDYRHAVAGFRTIYDRQELVALCRYVTERELTLISPTRIEGRTKAADGVVDWDTCTFGQKVWRNFTWIPEN